MSTRAALLAGGVLAAGWLVLPGHDQPGPGDVLLCVTDGVTERREGTLAERQRLSMEIHDSLAQGLSSQRMLLQAADRIWDTEPGTARGHVRTATAVAEQNLAEARRFVHDLAPAALVGQELHLRAGERPLRDGQLLQEAGDALGP